MTTNPPALASVQIAPARFVTIDLAENITGYTKSAIRSKIHKGEWVQGRQWVKRDGRVLIDLKGYEAWAVTGKA